MKVCFRFFFFGILKVATLILIFFSVEKAMLGELLVFPN